MKLILVTCILSMLVLSIQCRPQAVQIEPQLMRLLSPQSRSLVDPPFVEQRGSIEETQRILREIERINIAMGYRKKQEVAFPRTSNFNEGYFYPRPVYQPLNFRTTTISPAAAVPMFKQFTGERLVSSVDPFRAQVYYYPAPYLRVPMVDGPRAFHSSAGGEVLEIKRSKELSPKIYVLPIAVPSADGRSSEVRYIPSTVNFGSLQGFRSRGKVLESGKQVKKGRGVVEDMAEVVEEDKVDEDLLEEMLDAVDYDLDDDEDEKQQVLPTTETLANDKFINSKLTDSSEENSDEQADVEVMMLDKGVRGTSRSFNITATFQNFTNRFIPSSTPSTTLEPSDIKELQDILDTSDPTAPLAELEQEKGPFGLFNRQTDPSNGGIVIQRLRVRQGGIAIAGPGGIATAGSGGTAIVGPNGTAITHPRSLTIAGPGAKIYAVPESVDLGKTINATKRSLPLDAVLVANGPVVYYRN